MRYSIGLILPLLAAAPATNLQAQRPSVDSINGFIQAQIARRHIPGLSLAVIDGGKIVLVRGYGLADQSTQSKVTSETLFQAGSISKPVSALGLLHLVESGRLSLDANVNDALVSWKVPDNQFTATEKVTLRRILSHNAGLTVHGFPGYDVAETRPTLVQVLDGTSPANTAAIRVDTIPGAIGRYSGGGFTIMQQLMIDVTRTPFPEYLQKTVLTPIGMHHSSFDQPQPAARAARSASGYYGDRTAVRGRWHVYPEMAAAGLWTTPSDLARFAIEIQETLAGKGHHIISPALARQYVTEQKDGFGLGIAVQGSGPTLRFSHNGRDEGFDAFLFADETGHGLAIMINANDNSRMMNRIMNHIAMVYHWPPAVWKYSSPAVSHGVALQSERLLRYSGYYEMAENQMSALGPTEDGRGISTLADGLSDETFLPLDTVRFGSDERDMRMSFMMDSRGEANAILWRAGEPNEKRVARVAPLPSSRSPAVDPDPNLTAASLTALNAIRESGAALANASGITAGARKDFAAGIGNQLDGLSQPVYLGEEQVTGRGIRRHGSEVDRVRYYSVKLAAGQLYLLVHLTAKGEVADYDVVDK